MEPLAKLAHDLQLGVLKSRILVEEALAAIKDGSGEGARAVLTVYEENALNLADWCDRARASGQKLSPFAGIPITIKDLFDVAGEVTRAGSRATDGDPPADHDAPVIARLRAAGFILIGKTNMTEFAYSGLGMNAHFGTPKNPYDRKTGRIPGGSTSGGAVSVTDGMAAATIGTDTGGSCRIPAALCGIAGFKPTANRIPITGAFPLSQTLDSIGPLGQTLSCCAILDSVLSGGEGIDAQAFPIEGMRLGVPQSYVLDDMDETVAPGFEYTMSRLADAGAIIKEVPLKVLNELPRINRKGGFAAAEAYAVHRERMRVLKDQYDPWVAARIEGGQSQSAADYLELAQERRNVIAEVLTQWGEHDALMMPTTPIIAPAIEAMHDDAAARAANKLLLRNPSVFNFLDGCALSIPCQRAGGAPIGLMLAGRAGEDRRLLSVGKAVEAALSDTH